MSISRRQFFRGLTGPTPEQKRERRIRIVETYVRTNLFPYDFALTAEQVAEALTAAVAGIDLDRVTQDILPYMQRRQVRDIVDEKIQRWREESFRAEDVRRDALRFVEEFLLSEATPEDRERLRQRFHLPSPAVLEEEVERQVRAWLSGLSNAFLAGCDGPSVRELVFSELRSWC